MAMWRRRRRWWQRDGGRWQASTTADAMRVGRVAPEARVVALRVDGFALVVKLRYVGVLIVVKEAVAPGVRRVDVPLAAVRQIPIGHLETVHASNVQARLLDCVGSAEAPAVIHIRGLGAEGPALRLGQRKGALRGGGSRRVSEGVREGRRQCQEQCYPLHLAAVRCHRGTTRNAAVFVSPQTSAAGEEKTRPKTRIRKNGLRGRDAYLTRSFGPTLCPNYLLAT